MTNNKKVYQIGSLSIEKTSKPPESNKENLLSEIKSLNEKFNFIILSSDQKSNIPQNLSKASISQEHEGEIRKKLGDRTNSVFSKKSDVKALDFDKEIKDLIDLRGLNQHLRWHCFSGTYRYGIHKFMTTTSGNSFLIVRTG